MSQNRDLGQPLSCLPGCDRSATLYSVVAEDVVFVAAGAGRALQTAEEEEGHAQRHQESEGVFKGREPLNQTLHTQ